MSSVKLIGYTVPDKELLEDGVGDMYDLVAFCARVSNPSNQYNMDTSDKLIKYLVEHKHFSPFEMVNVVLEINTTRDIARQILRHRSFTFQEFSQRYADPTKDLSFVYREARLQDSKNRQNSIAVDDEDLNSWWLKHQEIIATRAKNLYAEAISRGIAKEVARSVLPEGIMSSRLYMNGTVRSWIHYLELRTGNGTQKEHQEIAFECAKVIAKIFPITQK